MNGAGAAPLTPLQVAPVSRLDWARNASGLRYADYWRGTLKPRPTGGRLQLLADSWVEPRIRCRRPTTVDARFVPCALAPSAVCRQMGVYNPPSPLPCCPCLAVDWYLQRVAQATEAAKRATEGAPMTLLAHSAGGWLGR